MTDLPFSIRAIEVADIERVLAFYPMAFPDEDLVDLVRSLNNCDDVEAFVAVLEDRIIGHVAFTACHVEGDRRRLALLGPLAVDPAFFSQGVGGALVRFGFDELFESGVKTVLVLGDPEYYQRFGCTPERNIIPPYPLPEGWADAWQSVHLSAESSPPTGLLAVPAPWRDEALWN